MASIHQIIEFQASSGHRLGVVTGAVGAKKLVVMTSQGQEMRPEVGAVSFELGAVRPDQSAEAVRAKLASLEQEIDAARAEIDLATVWEMAVELGDPMSAREVADLVFGDTSPVKVLASLRALREDALYFKQRKELWEARPVEQIAQLRAAREAAERKERAQEDFLESCAAILAKPHIERAEAARSLSADELCRPYLNTLQAYATQGESFDRIEQAEALLDAIGERAKTSLKGRAHLRAFVLMVELGLWDEHENIWLHRYHINTSFRDELLQAAQSLADTPWSPESWRTDMTRLLTFSVDDPSTRDIDDALSCEPRYGGGWRVGIHIADPDAFVPAGSALDHEARSRGTSVYLPTGTISMFPPVLSEGRMSLIAGELRPAMSAIIDFDEQLQIEHWQVVPSVVKVAHRLSYEEVDEMLEQEPTTPLLIALQDLGFLSSELYQRRLSDGATNFSVPDVKLHIEFQDGHPPQVTCQVVDQDSPSHTMVSEMMILINSLMARYCRQHDLPIIYRSQDPPEQPLIDEHVLSIAEGLARTTAMLRRMKRGDITTHPSPHFGLGLPMYVQSSSPIRRYSDLICQRQVRASLLNAPLPYDAETILKLAASVENTSREAMRTERETKRYWTLYHLQSCINEPLEATITYYPSEDSARAEVFLHAFAFRAYLNLKRKLPLGDTITVTVVKADPRQDLIHLKELA